MRTSTAIAILCVFMAGCQKDPAPAPASTAPPVVKPDAGLKDLLKRADAVTPKDAPDTLPAVPLGGAPPEKVVVVQGNRPGPAPYYGSSATPYSRTLPSTPQRSETETMLDKARCHPQILAILENLAQMRRRLAGAEDYLRHAGA